MSLLVARSLLARAAVRQGSDRALGALRSCTRRRAAHHASERQRLRAELDGLIAHLYGLTETEFAHILGTFALVAEPVKTAALTAWRDVAAGKIS